MFKSEKKMEKSKFDEMFDRLPVNIKKTDVLRLESKKVLAALLELLLHSEARNTGVIYCGNKLLRKLSGVGADNLIPALNQLEDYELITRIKGKEKGQASEYRINFKKLKEPIVEKTFNDLFERFCEEAEPSETPISTTITTTITTSTTTPITTSTTTSTPISTSTPITTETPTATSWDNFVMNFDSKVRRTC